MEVSLEALVEKAVDGDKPSLESLILAIKDRVYHLALKMLLFPEDAEDATQEILVRIITNLSSFRGESQFKTWFYRLATNYLITTLKKKPQSFKMSIEAYGQLIDRGQSESISYTQNEGEQRLLEEEVKVSCTHGLLLCLSEQSRMVYILGELLEFNSLEGANILAISPQNFRQQLSRSRKKIRNFLANKCGLANSRNACRCKKKIDFLIEEKMIDPQRLRYASHTKRSIDLIDQINHLGKAAAIYRSTPHFTAPETITQKMKAIIDIL